MSARINEVSRLLEVSTIQNNDGFLEVGQMYAYYPHKHFAILTLCRTRCSDQPVVHIKRKSIFFITDKVDTWRYIHCSGFKGWINVSNDHKDSRIFVRKQSIKRYEDWKAKNLFLFDGRIILGSSWEYFSITNGLIVLVVYLFFLYLIPKAPYPEVMTAIGSLLIGYSLLNLWTVALTEPGIIPRLPLHIKPRPVDPITQPGWKYCTICNILRPPQVKHCAVCQNCVQGFDHHCPYTSNCIGVRNRKYFVRFIVSMTAMLLFIFALGCTVLAQQISSLQLTGSVILKLEQTLVTHCVIATFTLVSFIALFIFLPFCYYHLFITAIAQTTFERVKGIYNNMKNPNDHGICINYSRLCCTATMESQVGDLREELTVEQYMKENLEPQKFENLFYGSNYGSAFEEISPKSLAGTEVV